MLIKNLKLLIEFVKKQYQDEINIDNMSPEKLNVFLQTKWLKAKDNVFRGQLQGKMPDKKDYEYLSALGFIDTFPFPVSIDKYLGIVILGATMPTFAFRINFLIENLKSRSIFWHKLPKIWLLASDRPIIAGLETPDCIEKIQQKCGLSASWQLYGWPMTEAQAVNFIWLLSGLGSFSINKQTIVAYHQVDTFGNRIYADTAATIALWLKSVGRGTYLLVTNQPYCQNQLTIAQRVAKQNGREVIFEVCGAYDEIPLARILDTVAKQLNEELGRQ